MEAMVKGIHPSPTKTMATNEAHMPGKDRDEESGKYTTSYSESDFLEAIEALGGMGGTADIAEEVGCTQRTAYSRLKSLEEEGVLVGRRVGNSLVWMLDE